MNSNFQLILGSNSPRRQELLKDLGFQFEVRPSNVNEDFSEDIAPEALAAHLAQRKAESYTLNKGEVVLTADTVVILGDQIMNKPQNEEEAFRMIKSLSGKKHKVITAICLRSMYREVTQSDSVTVAFATIPDAEIRKYIKKYQPFDKAGAYGIQEWLGMSFIESIEGSFYTVMGLPTHIVYKHLSNPESFL